MRFTRPDTGTYAHVIIDAGFEENGEALVEHVQQYYGTRSIDLAIVTHPDGDHIGGMGVVVRKLDVGTLCIHRLAERGGAGLPAADAVDQLIGVAEENGTAIREPFAGTYAFVCRRCKGSLNVEGEPCTRCMVDGIPAGVDPVARECGCLPDEEHEHGAVIDLGEHPSFTPAAGS